MHIGLRLIEGHSWGLSYNLYADKLLGTNVFPSSVFEMRTFWSFYKVGSSTHVAPTETAWYSTAANSFGVPLDTRYVFLYSYES